MMRVCGSSKWGRQALAAAFTVLIAGVAIAAEVSVVEVPEGNFYTASCTLAPGAAGAEVCGSDRGNGHINFRVGFGPDMRLTVNGVDAGAFDPDATYAVTIECARIGCSWFASTKVVNQATGEPAYQQMNYRMPGEADDVRAEAADVIYLGVS